MREPPILFNGPMVRANLEGRKTMTRRAVKPQPLAIVPFIGVDNLPTWVFGVCQSHHGVISKHIRCPYGRPGTRLVVREAAWMWCERVPTGTTPTGRQKWHYVPMRGAPVVYQADHPAKPQTAILSRDTGNQWGWRLKVARFLPRWASRITLEVTDVRVERLQDGEGEADWESRYLAEGINRIHHGDGEYYYSAFREDPHPKNWGDPFDAWRELWISINGQSSWDANPHVWVIEFKRVTP